MEIIGFQRLAADGAGTEMETSSAAVLPGSDVEVPSTAGDATDTAGEVVDTGSESETQGTDAGGRFPLIFDFNEDDDGFGTNEPEWIWNEGNGTFDIDVTYTFTPSWATLELYVSNGVWPGGVDWSGATSVEYRVKVTTSEGGYFRAFIQSIEQESATEETWLWYPVDYDLATDGDWQTWTLDLLNPAARLNLHEVTKLGLQIHAPEDLLTDSADTEVPLPEAIQVTLQVDSVIVRGTNP